MPYDLELEARLKKAGWKVKIRDSERLEEPHVTILQKSETWRLSLRSQTFLDSGQSWKQIDVAVKRKIDASWETLQTKWDEMYPKNPVQSMDDGDDSQNT